MSESHASGVRDDRKSTDWSGQLFGNYSVVDPSVVAMGVKPRLHKNGVWYLLVDHKGQRKTISTRLRGRAGRKAANRAVAELEARLALDELGIMAPRETPGTTLAAYTEEWLARREDLKIGSADLYARVLRTHWLPILGSKMLRTIRREEVVSALAAMRRASAKLKTRALRLDVLRSCLNSAIEDGLLSANPAARAGRFLQPAPAERRREIELSVFTAEELRRAVDTARAQFPREVHILVLTLARTGLRPGEGRCLQISDVDLKARQICVRRTEGRPGPKARCRSLQRAEESPDSAGGYERPARRRDEGVLGGSGGAKIVRSLALPFPSSNQRGGARTTALARCG